MLGERGKRGFSGFIATMVVVSMVAAAVGGLAGMAAAETGLIDGFEDGDVQGWNNGAGTLTAQTNEVFAGDYSAKLDAGSSTTKVTYQMNDPTAVQNASVAVRYSSWTTDDYRPAIYLLDNGSTQYRFTYLAVDSNGNLQYREEGGSQTDTGIDLSTNTWYVVRFENIDYANGVYDVAIKDASGNTVGTQTGIGFYDPASEMGGLDLTHDESETMWFDNFRADSSESYPSTVSGTVEDNANNSLANVSIEAVDTSDGSTVDTTTTDSAGAYSLELPDGEYNITATKSGFESKTKTITVTGGASGIDFELVPKDVTLYADVEDQDGNLRSHVTVEAWSGGSKIAETVTDGSGNASFAVGNGTYTLKAKKPHYANAEKTGLDVDTSTNATDAGKLVITRLGQYEQGLYKNMSANVQGNISEDELDYVCRKDPDGALVRGYAWMLDQYSNTSAEEVAGCEPDTSGGTQVDMLEAAASHNQSEQEMLIVMSNRLEDSRGVAYTKGKIAAVEALNNGKNKSQAKQAARDAIDDYYAGLEENIYSRWSTTAIQSDYIYDTMLSENEGDWIEAERSGGTEEFGGKAGLTVNLSNGETITVETYETASAVAAPEPSQSSSAAGSVVDDAKVVVYGPGQNASTRIGDAGRYGDLLASVETQRDQTKGNVNTLVESVYNNYNQDEISSADLIDPSELGAEAATDYNSTGYYSFAAAQMATLNATGNLSHSHTIEIDTATGTETVSGSLYYTGEDLDVLETGRTYDPVNYNGSFQIATNDGIREVNDPFTIKDATDVTTGDPVAETELEGPTDYGTANASNFNQTVQDLQDLRDAIQDAENRAPVGGGGGIGGGIPDFVNSIVAGVAAATGLSKAQAATAGVVSLGILAYLAAA